MAQKRRNVISLEKKIQILDRLKTGKRIIEVAKHFELSESTIRVIKQCEEKIRETATAGLSLNLKYATYLQNKTIQEMEKQLISWIENNIHNENNLSGQAIRNKAIEIFNDIRSTQSPSSNQKAKFLGSKGWLGNFKKRYSLTKCPVKRETTLRKTKSIDNEMASDCIKRQVELDPNTSHSYNSTCDTEKKFVDLVCTSTKFDNNYCTEPISKLTPEVIAKGLLMANELEAFFLRNDSNNERSLKFGRELRDCLSPYVNAAKEMSVNKNRE